jgi:MFS family permease
MLRKYASFVGLCLGFFLIMMDTTTVPLLYTTLMKVFSVNPATVAWANNIYLITYAAFLLLGGRLGDFTNRKMLVLTAYLTIGVGAALSGSGHTFENLIVGRALMGVGAGLLTPQSMAYIFTIFTNGGRGTALGIWGAVAGVATATGPIIAQLFLATANWRWVMWINIPIVLVCFLIAALNLPKASRRGIGVWDTVVSSVYGLCLAGAIVGIQFIGAAKSPMGMGGILFVLGTLTAVILIKNELKKKQGYILPPELWFDRTFLKVCFISGTLGLSLTAFYLPLVFLLDVRMNFGPIAICVIMMTVALSNALVGPFAGNISDRIEPEKIIRLGLILFAVANVLLGFIGVLVPTGMLAFAALCAVMVIAGIGTGLAFAPLANLALGRAQIATAGRAAAFYNSVRQVLSALGGVIIAIVFESIVRLQLQHDPEVTISNLRESSSVTAIASLACFLLISMSLAVAAYMSCRGRDM